MPRSTATGLKAKKLSLYGSFGELSATQISKLPDKISYMILNIYKEIGASHLNSTTIQCSIKTSAFRGRLRLSNTLSSLYCHYHYYWKEDHKEWDMKGAVEDLLRYNCIDCVRTWEIGERQHEITRSLGMEEQMRLKMETNGLCLRMINRGVLFDRERSTKTFYELNEALQQLKQRAASNHPAGVGRQRRPSGRGQEPHLLDHVGQATEVSVLRTARLQDGP